MLDFKNASCKFCIPFLFSFISVIYIYSVWKLFDNIRKQFISIWILETVLNFKS